MIFCWISRFYLFKNGEKIFTALSIFCNNFSIFNQTFRKVLKLSGNKAYPLTFCKLAITLYQKRQVFHQQNDIILNLKVHIGVLKTYCFRLWYRQHVWSCDRCHYLLCDNYRQQHLVVHVDGWFCVTSPWRQRYSQAVCVWRAGIFTE